MKKILILLYSFTFSICFGQSSLWKKIDVPTQNDIIINSYTSKGYIFGEHRYHRINLASKDNGVSWDTFNYSTAIVEDLQGGMYSINGNFVTKINENLTLDTLTTLEYYISNLFPLDTDNFIYGRGNYLFHKNISSNKLDSVKIDLEVLSIKNYEKDTCIALGIYKIGQNSFFALMKFSLDLKWIDKSVNTGMNYVKQQSFVVSNKRVFVNNAYSDNGGLGWKIFTTYRNQDSLQTVKGATNTIYHAHADTLFVSTDNGNTFTTKKLSMHCSFLAANPTTDNVIVGLYYYCMVNLPKGLVDYNPHLISKDRGNTFSLIETPFKVPFISDFSVGQNEEFFLNQCLLCYSKSTNNSTWKRHKYSYLKYLNNNSILAYDNISHYSFLSFDNGISWQRNDDDIDSTGFYQIYSEKENVIGKFGISDFKYSLDSGKVWYGPITPFSLTKNFISNNLNLYSYNGIVRMDLFSGLNFNVNLIKDSYYTYFTRLATSYSGNTLYGLRLFDFNGVKTSKIYVSHDNGNTFKEVYSFSPNIFTDNINIETDQFGNLYIFSDNLVYMSLDGGNSWHDISPKGYNIFSISELEVSTDNYLYIAANGVGILKYRPQLSNPNTLIINILDDVNKNCSIDANEKGIRGVNVNIGNQYFTETQENGQTKILVLNATYPISLQLNPDLYENCNTNLFADFTTGKDTIVLNIPIKVKKRCADPNISFSTPFLRRCFSNTYSGFLSNRGSSDALNSILEIQLDSLLEFESSTLPILSQNNQTIRFNAGLIKQGENLPFKLQLKVNCAATIGQQHCIKGKINSDNMCYNSNEYTECQANIGAYDPNDKSLYVNGIRGQNLLSKEDKLEYLIRFQNTGTDTAFTIRVEDPIVSKLNVSSIRPLAASHPFQWKVENRRLKIEFKNIHLVDSFRNEPLSHGFIKFEIKTDSLIKVGDDIENEAFIYFDFNDAIKTNRVIAQVVAPNKVIDKELQPLTLYPNPTTGIVRIENINITSPTQVTVVDILGKTVLKTTIQNNELDVSNLVAGVYSVQLKADGKLYSTKLIKQ